MEQVQAFLTDGSLNSENFYVDEDARAVPNTVSISAGGCFTFSVLLEPPFTVGIKPTSPAKTRLVNAVNNAKCASVKLSLVRFTQEYLKLADDIDAENAENAEEEVATQHDDEFDKFTMESINEAKKRDQMRYAEMDAELQRIRNQFDVAGLQKSTVDRILSDYQSVLKTKHFGWKSQPCGKALSTWSIDLFDFDKNTPLEKDMREVEHRTGKKCVEMLMTFPPGVSIQAPVHSRRPPTLCAAHRPRHNRGVHLHAAAHRRRVEAHLRHRVNYRDHPPANHRPGSRGTSGHVEHGGLHGGRGARRLC